VLLAQYIITYLIVVQIQAGQNPYEEKRSQRDQFPWRTARVEHRHPFQKRREKWFNRYKVKYPGTTSSLHHCEAKPKGDNFKEKKEAFHVSLHGELKMSHPYHS
jgi:hypothetical protein